MKKKSGTPILSRAAPLCLLVAVALPFSVAVGADFEARVTTRTHNVVISARPGTNLNESLSVGQTVTTGADGRVELTFSDQSRVRLTSRSTLTLAAAGNLELKEGAVLCDVTAPGRRVTIYAGDISAEIEQATAILECRPGFFKFLVLSGTGRLYRPHSLGDSVLAKPGQMVFGKPDAPLCDAVDFAIGRFIQTSALLSQFGPLPGGRAIADAVQEQEREKSKKDLIETNAAIFGGGATVSLLNSKAPLPASRRGTSNPAANATPAGTAQ